MRTERDRELIAELDAAGSVDWGPRALLACLQRLRHGGPTEGRLVVVHDAWATPDEFRVVYDSPSGPRVGIIRSRQTTIDRPYMYTTGGAATPEEFGREVADFNIGEPLGRYVDILEVDAKGLGWWSSAP